MPQANVWIKQEDWEKWQQIEHKSAWLSEALNASKTVDGFGVFADVRKTPDYVLDYDRENPSVCKNCGMIKVAGKCLTKGCK